MVVKRYHYLIGPSGLLFNETIGINDIIIRDSNDSTYFVTTIHELHTIMNTEVRPSYHEVIQRNRPQKLYFDIENTDVDVGDVVLSLISQLCINMRQILMQQYNITIDIDRDIIILDSCSSKKISYHIIVNNIAFNSGIVVKQICSEVINSLSSHAGISSVDDCVYKSIQNMRIYGSYKDGRCLRVINSTMEHDRSKCDISILAASLITYTIDCNVIDITPKTTSTNTPRIYIDAKTNATMMDIITKWMTTVNINHGYTYYRTTDYGLTYKRVPNTIAICPICNRSHDNDNIAFTLWNDNIVFKCWRNMKASLVIGRIMKEVEIPKKVDNVSMRAMTLSLFKNR